jgi:hypothetical protein
MRKEQSIINGVDMGKPVMATAILLVIFLSFLFSIQLSQASNPWFSTVIVSPTNRTYSTDRIVLETTTNGLTGANVHYSITYSLDDKENITVPFTTESHERSFSITMKGYSTLPSLSEGSHSITIYQKVKADCTPPITHSEIYTVNFTVDDQKSPAIGNLSIENKTYTQDSLQLNFTIDEATSWMGYSLDKQANITTDGDTTLTNLPVGSHEIQVFANDTAGNMAASDIAYFTAAQISNETSNQTNLSSMALFVIIILAVPLSLLVLFKRGKSKSFSRLLRLVVV